MINRINNLRKIIKEKNLDGIIITSRPNTLYMTLFPGSASLTYVSMDKTIFLTDFRYIEFAKKTCGQDYDVMMYDKKPFTFLYNLIKDGNINRIGFEDSDISYLAYQSIHNELSNIELVGIQAKIDELRLYKDDGEIKKLKQAVKIGDDAFIYILNYLKVGISEIEVAAEIEYFMKKNGAEKPSFDTIVASGKRSSLPHGVPTEKLIEAGDGVTMDFGAIYDGYCSDMTRTVFVGQPEDKMVEIYNIVLKAQMTAEENVKVGKSGVEIDKIARDIIYEAGYEGMFGHGLGHGVGIVVHEEPRLSTTGKTIMKNKMIVTVEPGIYVPNYGGVRIEDMVVVNDDKPIVLTSSAKELIII